MAGIGNASQAIWMSAGVASFNFVFTFVGLFLVERLGETCNFNDDHCSKLLCPLDEEELAGCQRNKENKNADARCSRSHRYFSFTDVGYLGQEKIWTGQWSSTSQEGQRGLEVGLILS